MTFTRSLVVLGAMFVAMLLATCILAAGQSEWNVHSFAASGSQGVQPQGDLVADAAGNLYGTASLGGASNRGAVYELLRPVPPKTAWTESVLYSFNLGDGFEPLAGVIFDQAGNLYGTTYQGGEGLGVVFKLVPPATVGGGWTESVIHIFRDGQDGAYPTSEVVFDSSGNLYGITSVGGNSVTKCNSGCGTLFQLTPPATPGAEWTERVLHYFNPKEGSYPYSTPILDGKGNLYGTTQSGVVYRLTAPTTASGKWIYKVLHSFGLQANAVSISSLTFHNNGHLYGTTQAYGAPFGSIFELVPPAVAGGTWTANTLYTFTRGPDGVYAVSKLLFDRNGNIYGTSDGNNPCQSGNCGTVFELTPPTAEGASWTDTVLHNFSGGTGGSMPSGGLIFDKNAFFGVTYGGGNGYGNGLVFGVVK